MASRAEIESIHHPAAGRSLEITAPTCGFLIIAAMHEEV